MVHAVLSRIIIIITSILVQSQKKFSLGTGPVSLMGTSACLGAEVLLKLLGNYCRNADIKTSITVGVVGELFY